MWAEAAVGSIIAAWFVASLRDERARKLPYAWIRDRWPGQCPNDALSFGVVAAVGLAIVEAGVRGAYEADTASGIVPRAEYIDAVSGFAGPLDAAIRLLVLTPTLLAADVIGRVWQAWFAWIPPEVPAAASHVAPVVLILVVASGTLTFLLEMPDDTPDSLRAIFSGVTD